MRQQRLQRSSGIWDPLPQLLNGCSASAAAVVNGQIYVAGGCSGTADIWQLVPGNWSDLHTETAQAFSSLAVTSDGTIVAANAQKRVALFTGSWQDFDGIGDFVAATGAHDVFAVAGGTSSAIHHWDGIRWSPVRLDPAQDHQMLAVGPHDVITISSPFPSPTPMVWTSFLRPP